MKQTAVEWLMPKILELTLQLSLRKISARNCELEIANLFEQAKEMDEKNLKDSFVAGAGMGEMFNNENRCYVTDAEQYLKETFKSE